MSLLSAALAMQAGRLVWTAGEGRDAERDLNQGRVAGCHPTKDGFLYLSATTDRFWQALCAITGLDDLAADPRLATIRGRKAHAAPILPRLHAALAARGAVEWGALMRGRIEDMFDHPQVAAGSLVAELPHAAHGAYRGLASPFRLGDAPRAAPARGEHTDEVLRGLG